MMQFKPILLSRQATLDTELRLNMGNKKSLAGLPYVLPVVVHIIHNNGLENIPDAQVVAAIEHMNQAFAHESYYAQQGDGTNTQIQFCLARRNPDGQLTNGITRTVSPLTDMVPEAQDLALKDLVRWDPTQYINIWVVASITSASAGAGVAGYAYLASSHGEPNDGVVCEAGTFGVDAAQEGVLIHEMGHYLNLYHTFEGGCGNGDCLSDGDQVCDTPPDQSIHTACPYNSCNTDTDDASTNNPFNSDVDDPTENFMDYSPFGCYRNFTVGQSERMQYAIEFFRNSLLASEGCKSPCLTPIATAFLPSATTVTAGQTVNFTNQTVGASSYEWYVNGNLIATSTNFSYQFTGTGNALVELHAYNADPNCLGTADATIVVNCGVQAGFNVSTTSPHVGEAFTATNTTTGATSYQWFINGVAVNTTTNLNYIFNNIGQYTVLLQAVGTYCTDEATTLITVLPPSGLEDCDDGFDNDGDGYVDCFDSNCHCFDGNDCITDALAVAPIKGKIEWQTGKFPGINTIPLVANLDPQNGDMPEIIVMEGISDNLTQMTITKILFYQGDGSNANNPRTLTIPQLINEREAAPVIGDVNSDGKPELAVVSWDGFIRVYTNYSPTNAQAMTLFATSDLTTYWTSAHLGMADFDGDGKPEIYSGHQVFQFDFTNPNSPQLNRRLVGFGQSGSNSIQTVGSIAADLLSVADCNGDPDCNGLEIAAGGVIYSVDLDPSDGDGLEIKTARNLSTMVPSDNFLDGYNYVADLNNDGILDIVTTGRHGSTSNFGCYAWNKNGLLRKFTAPFPEQFDRQFYTAAIANVFDDKTKGFAQDFPEIIYASSNYVTAFNLQAAVSTPTTPWWWAVANDDESGASGPSCFDFNADGFAEIVHRDEKSLRLMYGGPLPLPTGVDVDRNWLKIPCNSQTIDEYPVVADVDNDGEAEILASGYPPPFVVGQPDYRGRLWILGSDGLPWAPTRKVWNQFNYFGVNVNDDLTIPAHQQLHHLEFPGIGSGKRPFNTSHTQWSPLNDNFEPGFPVSDATVTVDSFACNGNNTLVWITLCNTGSNTIPPNYPIAFYKNDPRLPGANIETGISHGPNPIPVDSCVSLVVPMPTVLNAPIFVVVGDDASQTLPYSLADFPISDVLECNYANNFASFTLPTQGLDLDLGPDRILCNSSVTELNAGTGYTSYRWQDGSTDSTFTAFSPGKYWVDALDLCGFLYTDTLVISLNQLATVDLGNDRNVCDGESVTLSVSGFADVQWSPTMGLSCANCPTVTVTPTDTITYYVTAANGNCIASDSVRIFTGASPGIGLLTQDGDCTTAASITANASGNAPFDYEWSSGETTQTIQPAQAGTYSVTVTSAQGCTSTGTASVAFTNSLVLDIQATPLPCAGSFGEASATVNGGAAPYTYAWSNGGNTSTIQVATPGNLSVTITDANGCMKTASASVGVIGDLSLDLTSTPVPCAGVFGEAAVIANGGTAPFTYEWSNGGNTPTVQVAASGNMTVTITDANGCTSTGAVNVESLPAISLQLEATPVSCGGQSGEASVEVSGGTSPYAYTWSSGENTPTIPASSPGDFTVTVTDAKGCTSEGTATVGSVGSLLLDVQASPVNCSGGNGTASINASGGLAPYAYEWSNGNNTPSIQVNAPGSFTVTVTDATGCVSTSSVTIGLAGQLFLGIDIETISCFGASDGTATIIPINGTAPYNYLWANGDTGPEQTNISGGNFSVTVTDAIGCTDHLNFNITPPTALELDITATNATCFGQNSGTATVTASGGTPEYNYFWSNVQTEVTAVQLSPGWQTVTVTDENGCTDTTGILITQPTMLNASVEVEDPLICQGASTSVTVTATGGTPPFSFLWGNGETGSSVTANAAGAYIVTVTDANDCVTFGSGFLQILPPITAVLDSIHPASSPSGANGSIFVSIVGGVQPLAYHWSNGATTQDLLGVSAGVYSLTVTDAEGCEQVFPFTVDFLNASSQAHRMDWSANIYPNPTGGNGAATTLAIQSSMAQVVDFQLFDVTGKLLDKAQWEVSAGGWKRAIQAPDVAGIYLIMLSNEQEVVCLKWVVLGDGR